MNQESEFQPCWTPMDFHLVIGRSMIDFDWNKEEKNREKHGYSLASAVHFLEGMLLPIGRPLVATSDPIHCTGEVRHQHMTLDVSGNVVFFVTTMRLAETVRVISLRRATVKEEQIYYHACKMG